MKKNFVLYIAVVSFCLFLSGCKVSVSSSYETKLLAPKNFAVKEGKGCVMLVWDLPEENTSEDVEYFVEYDGKTVPVDKSACCKKISGLQNGTEYTFTLYGQKMQSGKKGYVSTAKATPSEDGIDMADLDFVRTSAVSDYTATVQRPPRPRILHACRMGRNNNIITTKNLQQ